MFIFVSMGFIVKLCEVVIAFTEITTNVRYPRLKLDVTEVLRV